MAVDVSIMSRPTPSLEVLLLLRAARRTGALEALMTTARTPAELAAETQLTDRAAQTLVEVLESEGFLAAVDGGYEPTNRSLGFFAKTDVRSIGTLPATLDRLDRGLELESVLTGDEPTPPSSVARRNRLGAAAAVDESTVRAIVTELVHLAPDADRVLDVGGAPGRYAVEFAARGADVTLYDTADRLDDSAAILAHRDLHLLKSSAATLEGLAASLPRDVGADAYDLLAVVDVSHRLGPDANRQLLEAATSLLDLGARVAFVERLEGEPSSRAAVTSLLETSAGRQYPTQRYREWFDAVGLEGCAVTSVPGTAYSVVRGRVPETRSPAQASR